MELIIGGAYQGKLTYAVRKYGFREDGLYDLERGLPERRYPCFYHLERLTRSAAERGETEEELFCRLLPLVKDSVVISREIGCGVVPMDPAERLFRELHGGVLRRLAAEADAVTRIFCGLEEKLK